MFNTLTKQHQKPHQHHPNQAHNHPIRRNTQAPIPLEKSPPRQAHPSSVRSLTSTYPHTPAPFYEHLPSSNQPIPTL